MDWMRLANRKLTIQISKFHRFINGLAHPNSINSNLAPKLLLDILCVRYDQDQLSIFKGEAQVLTPG
jgi:hypothetical protein